MNPGIFRAYDLRGVCGTEFEPRDFYTIARAYARVIEPTTVAVGHDVRATSPELWQQVVEGLTDAGVDVVNIGEISTDMLYFAVVNYRTDGGIVISASHNPADYNGMKLVRAGAVPISGDTGIMTIRDEAFRLQEAGPQTGARRGVVRSIALMDDYLAHLRTFFDLRKLTARRVVLNANCGLAGQVAERLLEGTPVEVVERVFFEPDGTFAGVPEGRPDPLREPNRRRTIAAVKATGADLAVAWDADADRCFFFDENAEFVEGVYVTARLAEALLGQHGPAGIVYDPRTVWPVEDCVKRAGGTPLVNKCGHSFIKERMRVDDALFGGECSAHYYFRRNFYTDNGMVPFLLVLGRLCEEGGSLSAWVDPLRRDFPVSGERNFTFDDRDAISTAIARVQEAAGQWGDAVVEEPVDGLAVRFGQPPTPGAWRLNLRESNTEPLVRLNVEAYKDATVLQERTAAICEVLSSAGGT